MSQFERTALLLGEEAIKALSRKKVAIFGLGGVGSWCCEALGRAGVGQRALIDHDTVSESNLNRQLVALQSTIGQPKAAVMAARLRDINPDIEITEYPVFYMPENADLIDLSGFDCIVDAIDTVTGKLELIQQAHDAGTPIISCMGAGNKLDAAAFQVADIYQTAVCPLARVMRKELRKRGIRHLKVVYSQEQALTPLDDMAISCRSHCICPPGTARKCTQRRQVPGSTAFVPAAAGLVLASAVVRDIGQF